MSNVFLVESGKNLSSNQRVKWELSLCKRLPGSTSDRHFIMKIDEIRGNKNFSNSYLTLITPFMNGDSRRNFLIYSKLSFRTRTQNYMQIKMLTAFQFRNNSQ